MATARGKSIAGSARGAASETVRRKVESAISRASFEELCQEIPLQIGALMGAASVRLYQRDALTEELFCQWKDGATLRELRVQPDPSSPVGYAAMTRTKSFAWAGDPPDRRYTMAVPMVGPTDLVGVLEMTHGAANTVIDDGRVQTFGGLADLIGSRLQTLLRTTVRSSPYDYLLKAGFVTRDTLRAAREKAARSERSLEAVLMAEYKVDKPALGRSLAEHFACAFVPTPTNLAVAPDLVRKFPASFLRSHHVLPVALKDRTLDVVVVNPRNLTLLDDLSRQLGGVTVSVRVAVLEDILAALDRVVGPASAPPPVSPKLDPAPAASPVPTGTWELSAPAAAGGDESVEIDSGTVRLVNDTLQAAIETGVSDIHFEALEAGGLIIRFRLDGVCHDHATISGAVARPVISRLKIMSQLDIAEHRLPQDGKIRLRDRQGRKIDLRVAVMPTSEGYEDIVLRILAQAEALPLDKLGMEPENSDRFLRTISQPHGIFLCVGPTGSGKTTTLHAVLGHLKNPEVKIWTAEDPVEITQPRVRQVQVQPKIGFTFERALRSFLRLDPDIIMIGEIRDRETADAAVEASLTGHLVLSTLHTNSAPETVTRLLEMGLDPFSFGDSLLGVLAQRLVRRVCSACRKTAPPTSEEYDTLRAQYGDPAAFDALKIDRKKAVIAKAAGCEACFKTGYKGRAGIHELLVVTPEIRRLVQKRSEAELLRKAARASGMTLLKQDGIRKVLQGVTDLREVQATCIEEAG